MILFGLAWGSFLNVVAYRLIRGQSIIAPRSYCPHCMHPLAWYDNIPLFSFIFLGGKCRYCAKSISLLYPFIEIITVLAFLGLFNYIDSEYWLAYGLFFSALIVTIRSDFETMLISRYVTLFLIPAGWLFSVFGLSPITLTSSIIGSIFGYLLLLCIAKTFLWLTGKEGMGQGDLELLAFIGSFIGPFGCWITLMLASMIGTVFGIGCMLLFGKKRDVKIPFGPFLAASAILFALYQNYFLDFLLIN